MLAGGRSSRMGVDKALLRFGEQSLLERALQNAGAVGNDVYIVGSRQLYGRFGKVVEDVYPGCGPLGGIHAALASTPTELNLILSVDMPLMSAGFLRWLLERGRSSEELVVVPDAAGGLQPLCATYRRSVGEAAELALQRGEYKIGRLFSQLPTRVVTEQEILAAGFSPEIFRNVNTPEEYEQCRPS